MISHQKPSRAVSAAIVFALTLTLTPYAGFSKSLFTFSKPYAAVRQLSDKLVPAASRINFFEKIISCTAIRQLSAKLTPEASGIRLLRKNVSAPWNRFILPRTNFSGNSSVLISAGKLNRLAVFIAALLGSSELAPAPPAISPRLDFGPEFLQLKVSPSISKLTLRFIFRAAAAARKFFEDHPAAIQAAKAILLPEIPDRDGVPGFTVTHDLAFGETMLFVVAELARKGSGIYLVIAPNLDQKAVVCEVNRAFGLRAAKELLTAEDEREAAQLLSHAGVTYKVLLTSRELHRESFNGVYQSVHVFTEAMRASATKELADIARILILARILERAPSESA